MGRPLKLDDAQAAELRGLRRGGASYPDLAGRFGLHWLTARAYCEGLHVPAEEKERSRRRRSLRRSEAKARVAAGAEARAGRRRDARAKRDAEIRRLWSAGWQGKDLAREFKLCRAKVSAIVAGLPRENRSFGPEDHIRAEGSPPVPGPTPPPCPRRLPPGPAIPSDPRDAIGDGPAIVRGSEHGRSVLDEARVVEMRRLRLEGWSTHRLSLHFGVGRNTVCYALSGVTWKHVPGALGVGDVPSLTIENRGN